MACMVALRGLILVCLLQLSVQVDVNPAVLAKIIQYFDKNVQPKSGAQYAIAISLSKEQCTDETFSIKTVFSKEEAKIVKDTINCDSQICELFTDSINVIAARPDLKNPNDHSEYRLLYNKNNGFPDSPMDKLLRNANENSCVVFYTFNSPCVERCIDGNKNILEGLSNWKNKQKEGVNVFVFRNIWHIDLKEDLTQKFQKIDNIVPLYRCHGAEQFNCIKCGDDNHQIQRDCVTKKKSNCLSVCVIQHLLNYISGMF
ncbi:uncharacterized protein [Paramisgurnus dabryanus]|uniref:uncharacterized protein n=1 Tax=Paramisgurnus dabryanus TaxID=90735 RepID=UPI0031F351F7